MSSLFTTSKESNISSPESAKNAIVNLQETNVKYHLMYQTTEILHRKVASSLYISNNLNNIPTLSKSTPLQKKKPLPQIIL
jgi:hypothetical protein